MIAVWVVGVVVLAGGAVAPLVLAGRRGRAAARVAARDRARSLISQLEWALDRVPDRVRAPDPDADAGPDAAPDGHLAGAGDPGVAVDPAVAEARRCLTLAESALAGGDETDADFHQAIDWAERGLRALGVGASGEA